MTKGKKASPTEQYNDIECDTEHMIIYRDRDSSQNLDSNTSAKYWEILYFQPLPYGNCVDLMLRDCCAIQTTRNLIQQIRLRKLLFCLTDPQVLSGSVEHIQANLKQQIQDLIIDSDMLGLFKNHFRLVWVTPARFIVAYHMNERVGDEDHDHPSSLPDSGVMYLTVSVTAARSSTQDNFRPRYTVNWPVDIFTPFMQSALNDAQNMYTIFQVRDILLY